MGLEHARTMARYNRWMNEKLYAVAEKLTDAERKKDRSAFFGSIHGTLNHLLLADRVWLGRLIGVALASDELGPGGIRSLDQELYADFGELRRERAKTDSAIEAYVATLTEGMLATSVRFVRLGARNELPLWHAVAQMFNHETHHRGQVTTLLMQAGQDPGVTDLIAMLRDPSIERELAEAGRHASTASERARIFRFEEVDAPRVRFSVKERIGDHAFVPFRIDAAFAFRALIEAFSAMQSGSFPRDDQPFDAPEALRRVESHPRRALFQSWTSAPFFSDGTFMAALAADFAEELHVVRAKPIVRLEDGAYQMATISLCLRHVDFVSHCVPGFHWSSSTPDLTP